MAVAFGTSLFAVMLVVQAPGDTPAQEVLLFNGRNLDGWQFEPEPRGENKERKLRVGDVWSVKEGLLISNGSAAGFLRHAGQYENYELTLEWRSMKVNANGVAVSGSGSVLVNASKEMGAFGQPKSIEIGVFSDTGSVYFRDVKPFSDKKWAFRAPDFADDVTKDLDEWNHLKVISRGDRITVFVNGTPVNQVDGVQQKKGSIILKSKQSLFRTPAFYRNIRLRPLAAKPGDTEMRAQAKLAEFKAREQQEEKAREAERLAEQKREQMEEEKSARMWTKIDVPAEIDFSDDVLKLPFPKDAKDFEFKAAFGDVVLKSRLSMAEVSKFYRTEMARRGWKETDKDRDEDSLEVTFTHGKAKVEMDLDQESDGTEIRLDCRGLSFAGTSDPAALAKLGIQQPAAYLALQKAFRLPGKVFDLEYSSNNRCLFKTDLELQKTYDNLTGQLRSAGYRETRRPIVSSNRRYSEFAKGRARVSVNVFSHQKGARAILTYTQ